MLKGRDRPNVPEPSYMSSEQKADYLQSLRTGNLPRPSGSRPPPPSRYASTRRGETEAAQANYLPSTRPSLLAASQSMPIIPPSSQAHKGNTSNTSSRPLFAGRPLIRQPSTTSPEHDTPAEPALRQPRYVERGTRWMEKQEVQSVRMALEDMDLETEQKLYTAAQDEAAELVYKHQNPEAASIAAYPNPDLRRDYRSHLRKGSYQRSLSQEIEPIIAQRKTSGGSHEGSIDSSNTTNKRRSMDVLRKVSPPSGEVVVEKRRSADVLQKISPPPTEIVVDKRRVPSNGKNYGALAEAVAEDIAKAHRRSSSGSSSRRMISGEKKRPYMHPKDRIWEDPQEDHQTLQPQAPEPVKSNSTPSAQPAHMRKNPFARVRLQATEKLERSRSEPIVTAPMRHSVEIQRNAPSQSRRPWYMSNEPLPPTPPAASDQAADEVSPKVTPTKDGREIRSDDIRAATSKKRNEYSPKLPRPTVVSDKPGRPIVSFEQDWKPKEVVLEGAQAAALGGPSKTRQPNDMPSPSTRPDWMSKRIDVPQSDVNGPPKAPVPTINLPDEPVIPTIVLPEEPEFAEASTAQSAPATPLELPMINVQPPTITVQDSQGSSGCTPQPQSTRATSPTRPLPTHAASSPLPMSRPHLTPSVRQSNTLCAHCALPIAGRILSASGERFHPSCFVCHQCHTNLELVAFYPEPEKAHAERASRIHARQSGPEDIPGEENLTLEERLQCEINDGDPALRFYCHLDFHELFSPRCKSCKTPIEGEVIVACGAEWHAGHFFCAQCGDPFDSKTPFVEKDGYAWCVNCHTNRYSSKCRKCRRPVTDTVVKALGFDWHENCFVCVECNGEFQDGKYFLRGDSQDPVCVRCEERRLKA